MAHHEDTDQMTFWEHLDVLRGVIVRGGLVILVAAVVFFVLKEPLFRVIFAPQYDDFLTYRFLRWLSEITGITGLAPETFSVELINTKLAAQFMMHVKASLFAGLLVGLPYVVFLLFGFISPAIEESHRRTSVWTTIWSFLLFFVGVLLNYFVIFPFTFRFLGTYQVNTLVENMIDLGSYMSIFLGLSLVMGLLFEIPILALLFAKIGLITAPVMRKFRKHAVVIAAILSAVITPTGDAVTMLLVAAPIYLLYACSIGVVRRYTRKKAKRDALENNDD